MKIYMINSVCGIKSTGRICTDLAGVLYENGHECRIAYGRESVPEKYRNISYRIGSKMDVWLHATRSRVFDCAGFGSKKVTEKLIQDIKRFAPDVIHLNNIHGYYLNIEVLFNFFSGENIPVVWTLHDCWAFTGHCAYFTAVHCDRWKEGCYHCPQKKSYPTSFLLECSQKNWNKKRKLFTSVENVMIITPSDWLAGLVKKSFLGKYEVRTISNGIDIDIFKPIQSDFRDRYELEDKIIILGVANPWNDRKGLDVFEKLAERLDDRYQVVLVGLSKQQLKEKKANILGLPQTNSAYELAKIYTAADIFINPTREDNYPTVNMEALACGTPVVTFCTGGSPEMLNKMCGSVVEYNNVNELEKEIIKVVTENKFSREFCLEKAKDFDKNDKFEEYIKLYEDLMRKITKNKMPMV